MDPSASRSEPRLAYSPGIDGLRGLAVLAVVVFHAGPATWLPGGFLGVSLFFTLSGYLIASLVLAEVESTGRLDLAGFWARRVRRLVPALLVTVVGVVALSRAMALPRSTRGELLGGIGYVANWVQLAGGKSYAELFQTPSAVTHLWSLAIEEQFYVVFPLLAWLVARRSPGRLRGAFVAGAVVVTAAGVAAAWLVDDAAFGYYATPARAPEIAVGVLLAALTRGWRPRSSRWWPMIGVVALGLTLAGWRFAGATDAWVARGGLAAVAVVSAALVICAVGPGRFATALGWRPLRGIGRISYGLYLFHWPVVVLLAHPRVHLQPVPLFLARSALALGLAVASFFLVERPIRTGRLAVLARPASAIRVGIGALVLAAVVAFLAIPVPPTLEQVSAGRPAPAIIDPVPATSPVPPEVVDPTAPSGPPVAVILGDSVPNWLVRDGGWGLDPHRVALIDGSSEGCDGAEGAPVGRTGTGVVVHLPTTCTGWRTQYPPVVERRPVDVAILVIGSGAVLDRKLDGTFRGPCSAQGARWYGADVEARLSYLAGHARRVVLVLPAWAEAWSGWVNPPDHHRRTDCVRATLQAAVDRVEAAAAPREGRVDVVDLAAELCPDGADHCRPWRDRDGVHIDPDRAVEVLRWIIYRTLA